MSKIIAKSLFFFIPLLFTFSSVIAQTITIGSVDPGPYGIGSTVAVPFYVNDASGCVAQDNIYSLYLCNASGTPLSATPVDTIKNFYGTFFNYSVPASLAPGTYTFLIKSSDPGVTSNLSNTFTVSATTGGTAAASCISSLIGNPKYPNVYGTCSGANNIQYTFTNASSNGSTTTATFFNQATQSAEASNINLAPSYNFIAKAANYTVNVRSVNANNIVSTFDYQLINNTVNVNLGATGNPSVCLVNGQAPLTYNVDISSATGIQNNYPGTLYTFSWGDGTPNTSYTLCQILALNGQITHNFTKSSCGVTANNKANSFEVDCQATNLYCGDVGSAPSNYARVFQEPLNSFTGPVVACSGSPTTFTNNSQPGPNPNATTSSCTENPNALYTWYVDGVQVAANYHIGDNFITTLPEGSHMITLHLQNPGTACNPTDFSQSICVQNPPQPSFTLSQKSLCIGNGPVNPTNTSIIDSTCNKQNTFKWTVTPSTGVTYNASAAQPAITFTKPGIYTVGMSVTSLSCGTVAAPSVDTIVVNSSPAATLSADFSVCGNDQTLSFDSVTTRPTYTILTGTPVTQPTTYTWTVTGGGFSYAPGYTLHSKYPHITFTDYSAYTVSVTEQNSCGSVTSNTQTITFEQSPTVVAGNDTTICANTTVPLQGKITGPGVMSYKWVGGNGTFSPNATSLNAIYTPTAAEISAGHVTLTLQVTTSIAAPCNIVNSSIIVTITPTGNINTSLAKTICSNSRVNYQITANNPSSTFTWTAKLISGSATGFTASGTTSLITDSLINTDPANTTNAVIAYTITPYSSNGCVGIASTLNVTVVPLPLITAAPTSPLICSSQPANISLSSKQSKITYTWKSAAAASITGNSNQATPVNVSSISDILINNSPSPAKVTYTIVPVNANGCYGPPITAVINVEPLPVTAYAGPDTTLCNTGSFTLKGNSAGFGSGKWTVVTGAGVTFNNDTIPNATVNGLVGGNTYQFEWTITAAPGCQSQSIVTVTVNKATNGGITSSTGPATLCANGNSGQITLSGQIGKILHWQQSIDNGATWQNILPLDTTTSFLYKNLTQTTQYQVIVQNGNCGISSSTVTTITVNQPAPTANAGRDTSLCNATSYQLNGNNPGTFPGVWEQNSGPAVNFADSTNYQTIISNLQGGNIYTFTWIIKAALPCSNSQAQVNITNNADVIAKFKASTTSTCGTQTITFTNLSNNQSGASFLWNFGDGSTSTAINPQHQFKETANGDDTSYVVSLSVVNNCNPHPPIYDTITVKSDRVIATILPQQTVGCAPFTITVQNTSPGNNLSYRFYLYFNTTLIQEIDKTDKSAVTFNPITTNSPTKYTLYMVATGECGATDTSNIIPIQVSPPSVTPQMYVLNGVGSGCAPLSVDLVNNSSGGSSFHYNIYDSNGNLIAQPVAGTANLPYIFTTAGSYTVSITASNSCSPQGIESAKIPITVYPVPTPSYTFSTDCSGLTSFANTTVPNGSTPAGSLSYTWNFGDGSNPEYTFNPQPHKYDYKNSPFTVTLTATNTASGCVDSTTQVITVNAPVVAQFTEKPDSVTKIPDYHFSFIDETTGSPVSWNWTLGDGSSSTSQNPEHSYADTGYYLVTLVTTNKNGCSSTVSHTVRVTGIPGQLFLPNAFMPTGRVADLQIFMAKGSGIKTWVLQIYNHYGQLLWETTKLDSKGVPVEGWDGTFRGVLMPQGAYLWQASATFINGSQWTGMSYNGSLPKRTGTVNLIR
ncbi:PKD domain-containing protein [Mucilaginibacter sp.]